MAHSLITDFSMSKKNNGILSQEHGGLDVAVAHEVYQRAASEGLGRKIELF